MKIAYDRPDGGVSIVTRLNGDESLTGKDIPPDATNVRRIKDTDVPSDRTFRNAWKSNGDGIAVDLPKARELHRERLRALRKPKMETLDVAYMRADERGDAAEKVRISALKQRLRDITAEPAIEAALTPEALKAVMPDILT